MNCWTGWTLTVDREDWHWNNQSCALDLPTKDAPIFLVALHSRATHLLTGDLRHFGRFMNIPSQTEGITICTVSTFLEQAQCGEP